MIVPVSDVNFEGRKNPKLHLRRKQVKNLAQKQRELTENCRVLEENFIQMGLAWQKVTDLPAEHPDAGKIAKLWHARFDMQHSFINGTYNEYKTARKAFAELAVKDYDLLKFVNNPININGKTPLFSKTGMNMLKNFLLDKLRIKTPAEKQLQKLIQNEQLQTAMKNTLGLM